MTNALLKTATVLLPGALMGAGVGALMGAFQLPPGSALLMPLQMAGILLMLGSIALRMIISQSGLSLTKLAGLFSNYTCLFLSALCVLLLLQALAAAGDLLPVAVVVAFGWAPGLGLATLGLAITAPWRQKTNSQPRD